jgi:DNA-binding transcriptional MerR regulator
MKAPRFPLTIQPAATEVGVTPGTLREYERLKLLNPRRDSTGRRLYEEVDIAAARRVKAERLARRGSGLRGNR